MSLQLAVIDGEEAARGESNGDVSPNALDWASGRRPPVGILRRLWSLGGMQAHIGVAYLAYWLRGFARSQGVRERDLQEAHLRAAVSMLSTMAYLRGGAIKVGQALASFVNLLPSEFGDTLERLHFDAPPMHFSLLREHFHNELGYEPEEVFATFETEAFAAASLGQVHRAVLSSGRQVVVKIQYPGIARTICSDFRVLSALLSPIKLRDEWEFVRAQIADARRVIERETDYRAEARTQREASDLFRAGDAIVVPRVYEEFSSSRVLTMERLNGVHVREFLDGKPSQGARDRFGELICVAHARLNYSGRLLYADVNPGNFLFGSDGTLGLLDFGCVRPYSDAEWSLCRRWDLANGVHQEEWVGLLRETIGLGDGEELLDSHRELLEAWGNWQRRPYLHAGKFDFGDENYLGEGMAIVGQVLRRRFNRSPAMAISSMRWIFGIAALLQRLGARVDVRAIAERESGGNDDTGQR